MYFALPFHLFPAGAVSNLNLLVGMSYMFVKMPSIVRPDLFLYKQNQGKLIQQLQWNHS